MTTPLADPATHVPAPRADRSATMSTIRPLLTPELAAVWDELEATSAKRQEAEDAAREHSAHCRELVVQLLRAGVPRQDLVDRPFSSAWLSRIQREEGLTRRRRLRRP